MAKIEFGLGQLDEARKKLRAAELRALRLDRMTEAERCDWADRLHEERERLKSRVAALAIVVAPTNGLQESFPLGSGPSYAYRALPVVVEKEGDEHPELIGLTVTDLAPAATPGFPRLGEQRQERITTYMSFALGRIIVEESSTEFNPKLLPDAYTWTSAAALPDSTVPMYPPSAQELVSAEDDCELVEAQLDFVFSKLQDSAINPDLSELAHQVLQAV